MQFKKIKIQLQMSYMSIYFMIDIYQCKQGKLPSGRVNISALISNNRSYIITFLHVK